MYLKLNTIRVANVHDTIEPTNLFGNTKPGDSVAVRPCGDKYGGKTYLGMYLCSAPTSFTSEQDGETLVLTMASHTNPAIYIPELDEIVWGYGSWWKKIKDQDSLPEITDDLIDSVWYVQAMKQIEAKNASE